MTWPFSEATCQIIGCVYFRRRSRRMSSDVLKSRARPWRRFRRNWGLPRKTVFYGWRWAWRRHGAAGLNRRRGPKKGLRRKMATGDPPGAALASSAPSAEGTSASVAELARAKARIEQLERLVGRQQLDLDFFARPCDLPRASGAGPSTVARPTLRAHQGFERGGEVARRKRNDERAREGDPSGSAFVSARTAVASRLLSSSRAA